MNFRGLGWDGVSLVLLSVFFVYFLWHSLAVVLYPVWLDESEGYMLNSAVQFLEGGILYSDVNLPGSLPNPYPPLFTVFSAFLMLLRGKGLLAGRLLSLFASLLCGFLLFRIMRLLRVGFVRALVFSLLFYTSRFIFLWSPLFRVDMLALFFSLCGIYFVLWRGGGLVSSVFFFVLAFYTKQSFIAAPLAVFLYCLLHNRRLGLKFFLIFLFSCMAVFILINQMTSGQFFLNIVSYNLNRFSWEVALLWLSFSLLLHLPLVLGSISGLVRGGVSVVSFYLILSLLSSFSVGKYGAYFNYFIEPFAVMIVVSSLGFANKGFQQVLLVVSCILFFSVSASLDYVVDMSDARVTGFDNLAGVMRGVGGDVLSEDPQLAISAGKKVAFHPQWFSELESAGLWNSSGITRACRNHEFSLVVLLEGDSKFKRFPELLKCVHSVYNKTSLVDVSGVKYGVYQ